MASFNIETHVNILKFCQQFCNYVLQTEGGLWCDYNIGKTKDTLNGNYPNVDK